MYKDTLREIYKNVINEKNTEQYPRILDYVNAVIKFEDPAFFEKNNEDVVHKKVEKIRRSVTHALDVLVKEKLLCKKNKYYVSLYRLEQEKCKEELLKTLRPRTDSVIHVSKRVFILPLERIVETNQSEGKQQSVRPTVHNSNYEVEQLRKEIAELKKEMDKLVRDSNHKLTLDTLRKNIEGFIGYECFTSVLIIDDNIVINVDSKDKTIPEIICNKISNLITEIRKNQKSPRKNHSKKDIQQ